MPPRILRTLLASRLSIEDEVGIFTAGDKFVSAKVIAVLTKHLQHITVRDRKVCLSLEVGDLWQGATRI